MSKKVTLAECPIGLFLSADDELCLRTEYGNNEGRIDAYIVSSGEFFWGDAPQTIASQRRQLVTPIDFDTRPFDARRASHARLLEAAEKIQPEYDAMHAAMAKERRERGEVGSQHRDRFESILDGLSDAIAAAKTEGADPNVIGPRK